MPRSAIAPATTRGLDPPGEGQLLQHRDDEVGAVDLEVRPQGVACVGTAEPVGPERRVGTVDETRHLVGHAPHVVRDGDHGIGPGAERLGDVGGCAARPRGGAGSSARPRGPRCAGSSTTSRPRCQRPRRSARPGCAAPPRPCSTSAPRSTTTLVGRCGLGRRREPVDPVDDPLADGLALGALGQRRHRIGLVVEREVPEAVPRVRPEHLGDRRLHDHGHLVGERRVVDQCRRVGGGQQGRLPVIVLQPLAHERGPPGRAAGEDARVRACHRVPRPDRRRAGSRTWNRRGRRGPSAAPRWRRRWTAR